MLRSRSLLLSLALLGACLLAVACDSDDGEDRDDTTLADTAATDTSADADTAADVADTVAGECPAEEPFPGGPCAAEGTCEYGMECCGATCGPSYVCECTGGIATSCLNTDIGLGCMTDVVDDGDVSSDTTGGACRSDAECDSSESCTPPGVMVCGTCFQGSPCADDTTCAAGEVCSDRMARCPCGTEAVCVPACASADDCRTGDVCDADGHCVPEVCASDADCTTAQFVCGPGEAICRRAVCVGDADCPAAGVCVSGLCYETAGTCMLPVP